MNFKKIKLSYMSLCLLITLIWSTEAFSQVTAVKGGVSSNAYDLSHLWAADNNPYLCIEKVLSSQINCEQSGNHLAYVANALFLTDIDIKTRCSIDVKAKLITRSQNGETALKSLASMALAFIEIPGIHGDKSIPLDSNDEQDITKSLNSFIESRTCSNIDVSKKYTTLETKKYLKATTECSKGEYLSSDDSGYRYRSCFSYKYDETKVYSIYDVIDGAINYDKEPQLKTYNAKDLISEECVTYHYNTHKFGSVDITNQCNIKRELYNEKIKLQHR